MFLGDFLEGGFFEENFPEDPNFPEKTQIFLRRFGDFIIFGTGGPVSGGI